MSRQVGPDGRLQRRLQFIQTRQVENAEHHLDVHRKGERHGALSLARVISVHDVAVAAQAARVRDLGSAPIDKIVVANPLPA